MYVYVILNKINYKAYFGITTKTVEQRWKQHMRTSKYIKSTSWIHLAMRKHGIDKFSIYSIDNSCTTLEELCEAEKKYIKEYSTYYDGYNMTLGGEGALGIKRSEETKEKMRQASLGNKYSLGRKMSSYNKEKLRQVHVGAKRSEETKKKISEALIGHKHTEESKRKMSLSQGKGVIQYDLDGKFIEFHTKIIDGSMKTKTNYSSIGEVCKGNQKTAGGHIWRYADDPLKV